MNRILILLFCTVPLAAATLTEIVSIKDPEKAAEMWLAQPATPMVLRQTNVEGRLRLKEIEHPENPFFPLLRFSAEQGNGWRKSDERVLEKLSPEQYATPNMLRLAANALMKHGFYVQALPFLKKAFEDGGNFQAGCDLARFYFVVGERNHAGRVLKLLEKKTATNPDRSALAELEVLNGNPNRALAMLQQIPEKETTDMDQLFKAILTGEKNRREGIRLMVDLLKKTEEDIRREKPREDVHFSMIRQDPLILTIAVHHLAQTDGIHSLNDLLRQLCLKQDQNFSRSAYLLRITPDGGRTVSAAILLRALQIIYRESTPQEKKECSEQLEKIHYPGINIVWEFPIGSRTSLQETLLSEIRKKPEDQLLRKIYFYMGFKITDSFPNRLEFMLQKNPDKAFFSAVMQRLPAEKDITEQQKETIVEQMLDKAIRSSHRQMDLVFSMSFRSFAEKNPVLRRKILEKGNLFFKQKVRPASEWFTLLYLNILFTESQIRQDFSDYIRALEIVTLNRKPMNMENPFLMWQELPAYAMHFSATYLNKSEQHNMPQLLDGQTLPGILPFQDYKYRNLSENARKHLWQAVKNSKLPQLEKAYFAAYCGRKKEALELLQTMIATQGERTSENFQLNQAALYRFCGEPEKAVRTLWSVYRRLPNESPKRLPLLYAIVGYADRETVPDQELEEAANIVQQIGGSFSADRFLIQNGRADLARKIQKAHPAETPGFREYVDPEQYSRFARELPEKKAEIESRIMNDFQNLVYAGKIMPGRRDRFDRALQKMTQILAQEKKIQELIRNLAAGLEQSGGEKRLLAAQIYDDLLNGPSKAENLYFEYFRSHPERSDLACRIFLLGIQKKNPQEIQKLYRELSRHPGFSENELYRAVRSKDVPVFMDTVLGIQKELLTSERYALLRDLLLNRTENILQTDPAFMNPRFQDKRNRILALYFRLARKGIENRTMESNVVIHLFQTIRDSREIPSDFRASAIRQYAQIRPNSLEALTAFDYLLSEYLKEPFPNAPAEAELWQKLLAVPEKEYFPILEEICIGQPEKQAGKTIQKAILSGIRIARKRNLSIDFLPLLTHPDFKPDYTDRLLYKSYMEYADSVYSPELLLSKIGEWNRILSTPGSGHGNTVFSYAAGEEIQKSGYQKIPQAILRYFFMNPSIPPAEAINPANISWWNEKTFCDLYAALDGTPAFAKAADFQLPDNWKRITFRNFSSSKRRELQDKIRNVPPEKRTFGMKIIEALNKRNSEGKEVAAVLKASGEELRNLTPEQFERVGLVLLGMRFLNLENTWRDDAFLREKFHPLTEKVFEKNYQEFIREKSLRINPIELCDLLNHFVRTNPEKAKKIIRKAQQIMPPPIAGNMLAWTPLTLETLRFCRANQLELIRNNRNQKELRHLFRSEKNKNPASFAPLFKEFLEYYPDLNEETLFLFIHEQKNQSGDPELIRSLKRMPQTPPVRTALALLEYRSLRKKGMPLPPQIKNRLIPVFGRICAEEPDLQNMLDAYPELMDKSGFIRKMVPAMIQALNRRTGNNPEKDPDAYRTLLQKALSLQKNVPDTEFKNIIRPLFLNMVEIFPMLTAKQESAQLIHLIDCAVRIGDKDSLEILKEYTDLVTPEYFREVTSGARRDIPPEAMSAFVQSFDAFIPQIVMPVNPVNQEKIRRAQALCREADHAKGIAYFNALLNKSEKGTSGSK